MRSALSMMSTRTGSVPERGQQNAPELRMLQQREGRLAVPVEIGSLPEHRHDAVDAGQLDQRVDGPVVQPRGERAERETDPDLGAEPLAPATLVGAQRG